MEGYVIGDKDLVLGLRLLGIKGRIVSKEESLEVLKRVIDEGDAKIIFISEEFSARIRDELDVIRTRNKDLLIVEVPERVGVKGETPPAQKLIQKTLKIRV